MSTQRASRSWRGAAGAQALPASRHQLLRAALEHDTRAAWACSNAIGEKPGCTDFGRGARADAPALHRARVAQNPLNRCDRPPWRLAHERLDGYGYHRGSARQHSTRPPHPRRCGNVRGMREARPYRRARCSSSKRGVARERGRGAASTPRRSTRCSLLAGHRSRSDSARATCGGGLSARLEVCAHSWRGASKSGNATALGIRPKTVGTPRRAQLPEGGVRSVPTAISTVGIRARPRQ